MQKFRSAAALKQAFAQQLAVVLRKRKVAQRGFDAAVSDCDETFAVLVGRLEIFTEGTWRPASPQSFAFFPRGCCYGIRQAADYRGPVEIVNILFRLPKAAGVAARPIHRTLPDLWWRRHLTLDADCLYDAAGQRVVAVQAVVEFLQTLAAARLTPPAAGRASAAAGPQRTDVQADWLEIWAAADELIRRRAKDGLTAAELARAVDVSPTQLRRIFLATRGETPKAALTRWRIDSAKKCLATGELSISQIAAQVGYRTIQRFSAAFKAATGKPPTAFARQPD